MLLEKPSDRYEVLSTIASRSVRRKDSNPKFIRKQRDERSSPQSLTILPKEDRRDGGSCEPSMPRVQPKDIGILESSAGAGMRNIEREQFLQTEFVRTECSLVMPVTHMQPDYFGSRLRDLSTGIKVVQKQCHISKG